MQNLDAGTIGGVREKYRDKNLEKLRGKTLLRKISSRNIKKLEFNSYTEFATKVYDCHCLIYYDWYILRAY